METETQAAPQRARGWLLAVLAMVLVALVAYQMWPQRDSADPSPAPGATAQRQGAARQELDPAELKVKLDALVAKRPDVDEANRNPFRFTPPPPPPAPPRVTAVRPASRAGRAAARTIAAADPADPVEVHGHGREAGPDARGVDRLQRVHIRGAGRRSRGRALPGGKDTSRVCDPGIFQRDGPNDRPKERGLSKDAVAAALGDRSDCTLNDWSQVVKRRLIVLLVLTALVSGCTAGRAFRKGRESARTGDWDAAVVHFTEALQANPDNAEYKIELERATQNAARDHITRAREFEQEDQLDAALIEYKQGGRARSRRTGSRRARRQSSSGRSAIGSRSRVRVRRSRRCGSRRARQGGAGPQPGRSHAAQAQLQQLEPARHPQLHRHDDRHQHSATTARTSTSRTA